MLYLPIINYFYYIGLLIRYIAISFSSVHFIAFDQISCEVAIWTLELMVTVRLMHEFNIQLAKLLVGVVSCSYIWRCRTILWDEVSNFSLFADFFIQYIHNGPKYILCVLWIQDYLQGVCHTALLLHELLISSAHTSHTDIRHCWSHLLPLS